MFTLQHGHQGAITGVVKQTGGGNVLVPIDIENQLFCDFLTWDCRQAIPLEPTISLEPDQKNYYFADVPALLDHCKRQGTLVYVQ